jgi:Family of unknown function (DUF6193)
MIVAKRVNDLYPDLFAAGGLVSVLQDALRSIGSSLTAGGLDTAVNFAVYACVESGSRQSQVYIAAEQRLFLFDCWSRGVCLAHGSTPSLTDLARAIDRWVGSACTTAELASEFGFVAPKPEAAGYERGEEVEDRWRGYLSGVGEPHLELTEFISAAARRRELRQLFPYTSLDVFCFSRCTGYPFSGDLPSVRPVKRGRYEVVSPSGRVIGRGNAEDAADLVVAHLPPGCGPAVPGTADDLARAESGGAPDRAGNR